MSEDDAHREAERRFGDIERTRAGLERIDRQHERGVRRAEWWDAFVHDARYALRGVRRSPGFAAMVAITLGLGIGANAVMFGIIDRLLLRGPDHVVDAGRLRRVFMLQRLPPFGDVTQASMGYVTYQDLRDGTRMLEGVAAYAARDATVGRGAGARSIKAAFVTWDFFSLLGVRPLYGRFFNAAEDDPVRAEHVVVLDEGFWRAELGAEPDVIGRTVAINDTRYTVVGVAPRGFTGVDLARVDAWMPMSLIGPAAAGSLSGDAAAANWTRNRSSQWLRVIARLRPGVTSEQADADATTAHRRAAVGANKEDAEASISLQPLVLGQSGKQATDVLVAKWLVGVAVIVLVIACANVANLLLARTVRRRRELAVRLALGIGRARLLRLLLVEGVVLAGLGSLVALALAQWGSGLVRAVLLPGIEWTSPPLDPRVLAIMMIVTVGAGLLVAIFPAVQAGRADVAHVLKATGREGGGRRSVARRALTIAQSALATLLLVGAGLFVRSLLNASSLHLGVEPARVLTLDVDWPALAGLPPAAANAERARRRAFYDRALDRMRSLPDVEHAAIAVGSPFGYSFSVGLRVPGRDSIPDLAGGGPYVSAVTSGFFDAIGTRLLSGRIFRADEGATTERVAIVNETMAKLLWPGADPIGKCLLVNDQPCSRIVGVVENARRYSLREPPAMQYYLPFGQEKGFGGSVLFVRPRGNPTAMVEPLRRELLRLSPSLPFVSIETMQARVDPLTRPWRLGATMFGVFGALALVVAAVGLFSVLAYLVAQRTHEIGVRVALGAHGADVAGLVLREGAASTALGCAIGMLAALSAGHFVGPLLFDTSPRDPLVFALVALALMLVTVAASLLPARRASRVDPLEALRAE